MPAVAVTVAIAAPTLLAYNLSPSVTVLNQLLAAFGWGAVLLWWRAEPPRITEALGLPLSGGVLVVALACAAGVWGMGLPPSMAVSALAFLGIASLLVLHGHAADSRHSADAGQALASALLVAGLASALIAMIQVFAPSLADGEVIAKSGLPGRAVGNLRQPNHLSSLLLWGLIGWVPAAQRGRFFGWRLDRPVAMAMAGLLLWAVVLTASRTGLVGVVLLALWGLVDRRLAGWVRGTLLAAPVAYLLVGLAMSGWAHTTGQTFGGEARLAEGDVSASRFGIWANTLTLIRQQPWTGVGFGEFNFAWTLTPFPGRPVAFFDHTHNLPLQLWVELGIPFGTLVLALLLWALAQAGLRSWRVVGDEGAASRAAFMMVLMIGVHSLFEYPLWYAYFLLPTAWAWGYALRAEEADRASLSRRRRGTLPVHSSRLGPHHLLRVAGALMIVGSLYALYDYWKVVVIYAPSADAGPLPERIEHGQTSVFYAHHADYAAATTAEPPSAAMGAFHTTTHSLLDTRLMVAWAQALNESGHREKASYLAARLREFRNPAAAEFFEDCNDPAKMAGLPPPFQCVDPPEGLTWRHFRVDVP
ncbi:Wzy polymerase domain-containing protein [Ideonella sp. DXS29W]|uniref:Wzy polymerase domain-containing protein n=1 Tax=Ideonella lacteola TaxID=2984193 RepID=A0ABU9BLX1_9BURK